MPELFDDASIESPFMSFAPRCDIAPLQSTYALKLTHAVHELCTGSYNVPFRSLDLELKSAAHELVPKTKTRELLRRGAPF